MTTENKEKITAQVGPMLNVLAQGLKDLSFENKSSELEKSNTEPKIDINITANAKKLSEDNQHFEVVLRIQAHATQEEKTVFMLEVDYMGVCHVEHAEQNNLGAILLIQVPNLLFPFARQIVANTVAAGGFPPLMLQPVDFAGLYQQQLAHEAKRQRDEQQSDSPVTNLNS